VTLPDRPENRRRSTRRAVLAGGTAVVVAAAAALWLRPQLGWAQQPARFARALAVPPLDQGQVVEGVRVFALNVADGETEFFEGIKTATRGINAPYLGPTLQMRKGETVRIEVRNSLAEPTTLHWHGLNVPAVADGGPHQVIAPGAVWAPSFTVHEVASTMWYHSHLMHSTARQVWQGMAGVLRIADDAADALGLPDRYGIDDFPIVLQDRRFTRSGTMPYAPTMHDAMAGMIGDVALVNGTIQPHLALDVARVRLRLLNGSNASIYDLGFADGRGFHQIASDGGLLARPVALNALRLAPGERAEIVVDISDGRPAVLRSVSGGARGMGMRMMAGAQNPAFEFLELRPKGAAAAPAPLPEVLAEMPRADAASATRTRRFVLEMGMMGGGFAINGASMDMERVDQVVTMGETEIWEIANAGPMMHPFHVHNTQFRVLDRDGLPPASAEAGRKDTVLVEAGETVRILVRFDHYTDRAHPYMYHCHILEHEDAGMMGQFIVV